MSIPNGMIAVCVLIPLGAFLFVACGIRILYVSHRRQERSASGLPNRDLLIDLFWCWRPHNIASLCPLPNSDDGGTQQPIPPHLPGIAPAPLCEAESEYQPQPESPPTYSRSPSPSLPVAVRPHPSEPIPVNVTAESVARRRLSALESRWMNHDSSESEDSSVSSGYQGRPPVPRPPPSTIEPCSAGPVYQIGRRESPPNDDAGDDSDKEQTTLQRPDSPDSQTSSQAAIDRGEGPSTAHDPTMSYDGARGASLAEPPAPDASAVAKSHPQLRRTKALFYVGSDTSNSSGVVSGGGSGVGSEVCSGTFGRAGTGPLVAQVNQSDDVGDSSSSRAEETLGSAEGVHEQEGVTIAREQIDSLGPRNDSNEETTHALGSLEGPPATESEERLARGRHLHRDSDTHHSHAAERHEARDNS